MTTATVIKQPCRIRLTKTKKIVIMRIIDIASCSKDSGGRRREMKYLSEISGLFAKPAKRPREPVRSFSSKNPNKILVFFFLAGLVFLSVSINGCATVGSPREPKEAAKISPRAEKQKTVVVFPRSGKEEKSTISAVTQRWKDKLVFFHKKDRILFEKRAPDSLKKAMSGVPVNGLKINCYMVCRRNSGGLHALGMAVDISTRRLSRGQLLELIEYLYNLPQTEELLTGQIPQYNILGGEYYFGRRYNSQHKTHVHYGVKF